MLKIFFADKWYFLCIFMCLLVTRSDGFSWVALYWKFSSQLEEGQSWVCEIAFSYCWLGKHSQQKEHLWILVLKEDSAWHTGTGGAVTVPQHRHSSAALPGLLPWALVEPGPAPKGPAEPQGQPCRACWAQVGGTTLPNRTLCSLLGHKPSVHLSSTWRWQTGHWVEQSDNVSPWLAPGVPQLCSIPFTCLAVASSMNVGLIGLCAHF